MSAPHPWVVFAERVRGFDTREAAIAFARANVPSVVCERREDDAGAKVLVEVLRHDWLYDEERHEWRVMLG